MRERSALPWRRFGRPGISILAPLVFAAMLAAPAPTVRGQEESAAHANEPAPIARSSLLRDIAYLDRRLQDVHPDPFTAFGGRVAYQLAVRELTDRVPSTGLSRIEFAKLLRPLFARLGDGHSWITMPAKDASHAKRYLPVRFRVASDAIFVSQVQPGYEDLIGYRLVSADGRSVASLREAASLVLPTENEYDASWSVARKLPSADLAVDLSLHPDEALALTFLDRNGTTVARQIGYVLAEDAWRSEHWVGRRWSELPETNAPFFHRLWPDRHAAYFRLRTIMARDALELMRAHGRTDLDQRIRWFYSHFMETPPPEDQDEAIALMPSVTESARAMLINLDQQGIDHLIVDLRGNDGGWSAIMIPFYYLLFGDRYFADEHPVIFATRISKAYLEMTATSLEAFNAERGTSYELGDLLISSESPSLSPAERRRRYLAELDDLGVGFRKLLAPLDGKPICSPKVYVVTDPATFSAAYDLMYHLSRLGAKVVGVPPRQSANTFVDPTPFELPTTKLRGAISRTAVRYPEAPERDGVWQVDLPMTWERFRTYDFDAHSDIRFVLDMIDER